MTWLTIMVVHTCEGNTMSGKLFYKEEEAITSIVKDKAVFLADTIARDKREGTLTDDVTESFTEDGVHAQLDAECSEYVRELAEHKRPTRGISEYENAVTHMVMNWPRYNAFYEGTIFSLVQDRGSRWPEFIYFPIEPPENRCQSLALAAVMPWGNISRDLSAYKVAESRSECRRWMTEQMCDIYKSLLDRNRLHFVFTEEERRYNETKNGDELLQWIRNNRGRAKERIDALAWSFDEGYQWMSGRVEPLEKPRCRHSKRYLNRL